MDNKARIYNVYSILKILQNIMCIFDTLIITLINPEIKSIWLTFGNNRKKKSILKRTWDLHIGRSNFINSPKIRIISIEINKFKNSNRLTNAAMSPHAKCGFASCISTLPSVFKTNRPTVRTEKTRKKRQLKGACDATTTTKTSFFRVAGSLPWRFEKNRV